MGELCRIACVKVSGEVAGGEEKVVITDRALKGDGVWVMELFTTVLEKGSGGQRPHCLMTMDVTQSHEGCSGR